MWNRKDIKTEAKANFRKQYWKAVVFALLITILGGSYSSASSGSGFQINLTDKLEEMSDQVIAMLGIGTLVVTILVILIRVFVFNPLILGGNRYFLRLQSEEPRDWDIAYFFSHGWENVAKTLFFRDLFIILWALLFVIPGFIKAYEYRMIPYLLCENPEMDRHDAFAESKRLMSGNKWAAFVLDLSFILWHILNSLTLGIVGVFWLNPYLASTDAQLYCTLRRLDSDSFGTAW